MEDNFYMGLAMREAELALKNGNLAIGACLVCNGKVVGTGYNTCREKDNFISHAKLSLIYNNSSLLRKLNRDKGQAVLYTTLETVFNVFWSCC